jgi:hypothetical protein
MRNFHRTLSREFFHFNIFKCGIILLCNQLNHYSNSLTHISVSSWSSPAFSWSACVYYTTLAQSLYCDWEWERETIEWNEPKRYSEKNEGTTENTQEEEEKNIKKKLSASFFPASALSCLLTYFTKKKAEHVSKIVSVSEWEKNFSVAPLLGLFSAS